MISILLLVLPILCLLGSIIYCTVSLYKVSNIKIIFGNKHEKVDAKKHEEVIHQKAVNKNIRNQLLYGVFVFIVSLLPIVMYKWFKGEASIKGIPLDDLSNMFIIFYVGSLINDIQLIFSESQKYKAYFIKIISLVVVVAVVYLCRDIHLSFYKYLKSFGLIILILFTLYVIFCFIKDIRLRRKEKIK